MINGHITGTFVRLFLLRREFIIEKSLYEVREKVSMAQDKAQRYISVGWLMQRDIFLVRNPDSRTGVHLICVIESWDQVNVKIMATAYPGLGILIAGTFIGVMVLIGVLYSVYELLFLGISDFTNFGYITVFICYIAMMYPMYLISSRNLLSLFRKTFIEAYKE